MEEGTIAKWRKKEGDYVKSGDVLFEVATDKATVEHSALDEGFLRKIIVREGETAIVNQAVAIFTEKKEESIEGYKPEGEMPKVAAAQPGAAQPPKEGVPPPAKPSPGGAMSQPAFVPEPPLEKYSFSGPQGDQGGRIAASPARKKISERKGN